MSTAPHLAGALLLAGLIDAYRHLAAGLALLPLCCTPHAAIWLPCRKGARQFLKQGGQHCDEKIRCSVKRHGTR